MCVCEETTKIFKLNFIISKTFTFTRIVVLTQLSPELHSRNKNTRNSCNATRDMEAVRVNVMKHEASYTDT